jgi:hypothetical protein
VGGEAEESAPSCEVLSGTSYFFYNFLTISCKNSVTCLITWSYNCILTVEQLYTEFWGELYNKLHSYLLCVYHRVMNDWPVLWFTFILTDVTEGPQRPYFLQIFPASHHTFISFSACWQNFPTIMKLPEGWKNTFYRKIACVLENIVL